MGQDNTATGAFALLLNTIGSFNTANGFDALFSNTEGQFNTADGDGALDLNTTGDENTAIGASTLQGNVDGSFNTGIGSNALQGNASGSYNTALGDGALINGTGMQNTVLGAAAGLGITTANNVICIGYNLAAENVDNSCYINNIFNQASSGGSAVFVNAAGKLGTTMSSHRFKEEIKAMGQASEALFALKPVSFRYKKEIDPAGTSQLGLVAEDVEKVDPDLVVRDKEGKAYSVRYDQVNAMLLNEFLKEHRKVEMQEQKLGEQEVINAELKSAIAQQQKAMEAMAAQLKEQAGQIQKVSARIEMSTAVRQVVVGKP
jgi:uncharacterized coiled-coil protein SlyX